MSHWNHSVAYRLTQPFRIEAVEQEIRRQRPDDVLARPRLTSVCASDLKLYAGARDRRALSRKLPLALLHEGVAEVVETGPAASHLRPRRRTEHSLLLCLSRSLPIQGGGLPGLPARRSRRELLPPQSIPFE